MMPPRARRVGETAGERQQRQLARIGGYGVHLLIVPVLQAVLEIAQEDISGGEFRDGRPGQKSARVERSERRQRAAQAQAGLLAAAHELQRLDDEFDFADTARPELDIARVVPAPALLADLVVHVAQPGVRVVIEILAKYEGDDEFV